jgi:hypothetical protein
MAKNFTLRLPDDEASQVQALARAEGLSLNETVRRALAEAVAARRADPEPTPSSSPEFRGSSTRTGNCSNDWRGDGPLSGPD